MGNGNNLWIFLGTHASPFPQKNDFFLKLLLFPRSFLTTKNNQTHHLQKTMLIPTSKCRE